MSFKLIIDEAALQLISKKLPGFPVYAGPNGDLLTPGIVDILNEEITDHWQPSNEHTEQLVLGAAACRDILFYLDQFLEAKTRKRAMNRMAVPICSLIDVVRKLLAVSNDLRTLEIRNASWPSSDHITYKQLSKRLNKMNANSPVRRVRNKLAAHLDSDIFTEKLPSLSVDDILEPLGDCAVLLMLSINYPTEFFQWIRPIGILEDRKHLAVETMYSYPICVRWITDLNGHVKDIESITLATDPCQELQAEIMATVSIYNNMIKVVNSKLPPIYTVLTDDLREQEKNTLES
jgi:hypothetical protein